MPQAKPKARTEARDTTHSLPQWHLPKILACRTPQIPNWHSTGPLAEQEFGSLIKEITAAGEEAGIEDVALGIGVK